MACLYLILTAAIMLTTHVVFVDGFDIEDCPKDCQCSLEGTQMMVDCAGLSLTDLPKFSDNEVKLLLFQN
jgi:hypothetical protein